MAFSLRRDLPRHALTLGRYLRYHPGTVLSVARHAVGRRIAIPLDVIRWALDQLPEGQGKPDSLYIASRPPCITLDASLDIMGNKVRAGGGVEVERLTLGRGELRLGIRLHDLHATALDPNTNIGKMLTSGILNLKKPADLLKFIPKRPPVIAGAEGDRFELDLMQLPQFMGNTALHRVLMTISPVLFVTDIRTEGDWLLVQLQTMPSGLMEALSGLRG